MKSTLSLQYAREGKAGAAQGVQNSVNQIGTLVGYLVIVGAFSVFEANQPYKLFFALAAVLAASFRQAYLRRSAGSDLICVGGAMILYEMGVFAMGLFQGLTYRARWPVFVMTAIVGTLTAGAVYALLKHIGTIGGNAWKE